MSLTSFEEKRQAEINTVVNQLAGTNSSLAACSLVSKRWHARCRQQCFRRARLADIDDLRSSEWPLGSDGPPSHRTQCGELWISCSIPQQLSHFKTITRITSLTLDRVAVTLFDFPALQRTFRDLASTITNLRLLYPSGSPGSLLQFIMIFRNLQVTTVHAPSWVKQNKDTHTVHFGQLHGTLCLSEFNDRSNPFLSLLELHAAGIKKVTISECNFHDLRPLQRLLSSAGRNIQDLQLIVGGNGEVPELSLQDCPALEQVFLSVIGPTASFHKIATLISSISSTRFRSLVLKLRTTARRESDVVQVDLTDRIGILDVSLSRLGRVASARGHKVSLVLLGQEPEFLAQGLADFHEVGWIWAGEDIGDNNYFWTFTSPESKMKRRRICILDRLFGRKD